MVFRHEKTVPLYRAYNQNAKASSQSYTVNYAEQKKLLKVGWRNEWIAWYGTKKESTTPKPTPVTKYKVTVNVICEGKVIKTKSEMIEKDKQYTDFAEEISGYILNEYNVKSVIVNNNTTISFDYKKVELVDTFNMKIYVDNVYYKTIKKGESYQPATKNLGLDENEFNLSNSVTDQPKNWIDGQTYNYDFYVSHYELLSNAEKIKAINTILSILI